MLNIIRYSRLARRVSTNALPKLRSLTRVDAEITIEVSKLPLSLRDILQDRAKANENSWKLIKSMLNALIFLEDNDIVVRNI